MAAIKKRKKSSIAQVMETTQGRTYTVILVTFLAIVLMIVVAISPAYLSITNKLSENEARRAYIEQLDQKQTNLDFIVNNQESQLATEIGLLDTLYADKNNDEFISANIAALSDSSGAVLTSIGFDRSDRRNNLSDIDSIPGAVSVKLSMSVIGTKDELELFIEKLESFPAVIIIHSLSYSLVEDEDLGYTGDYQMSITAEYFHYEQE